MLTLSCALFMCRAELAREFGVEENAVHRMFREYAYFAAIAEFLHRHDFIPQSQTEMDEKMRIGDFHYPSFLIPKAVRQQRAQMAKMKAKKGKR